jgi:Tir chaperone family protein CesT
VGSHSEAAALQELLGSLSDVLGAPLSCDGTGRCALSFDGGLELLLAADESRESLTVSAELGVLADPATCQKALDLNYGRLPPALFTALDRASGQLVLFSRLPIAMLSGEALVHLLADFVECQPLVRSLLVAQDSNETESSHAYALMLRG